MDYRLYVPSVPAAAGHGLMGHRAAERDPGEPQTCADRPGGPPGVLAVLNQGLAEDTGLIIGKDEVTVDNDRQVEVKGRRKADTAVTRVAVTP